MVLYEVQYLAGDVHSMLEERIVGNQLFSSEQVSFLEQIELLRLGVARKDDKDHKADLGQFFTPMPVAHFMVSLLNMKASSLHILDAGAGVGSLSAACVIEICQ